MSKVNVGLGQAARLAQLPYKERLALIAEGLPLVLESANGFLRASKLLPEEQQREADVLSSYAEEEAAKALILMDMVRCPQKLVASKIGTMTKWFYNHLARMIYAQACHMRPTNVLQLQEYVNHYRAMHYVDGEYGEYIFPNNQLFSRESRLYADIGAHEDDTLFWNAPTGHVSHTIFKSDPSACVVAEALAAVGAFSIDGLSIVAEVWGREEFFDGKHAQDSDRLIEETLRRLIGKKLPLPHANDDHVGALYQRWQFPMYNLDLRPIEVSLEELARERDALAQGNW